MISEEHIATLGDADIQDKSHHPGVLGTSFGPPDLSKPTSSTSEFSSPVGESELDEGITASAGDLHVHRNTIESPRDPLPMTAGLFGMVSADTHPRTPSMAEKPTISNGLSRTASDIAATSRIHTPRTVSLTPHRRAVCDSRVSKRSRQ